MNDQPANGSVPIDGWSIVFLLLGLLSLICIFLSGTFVHNFNPYPLAFVAILSLCVAGRLMYKPIDFPDVFKFMRGTGT